ncbi:MAG TPA: HYR domain-containing protein, partial [Flavobacteriales bacterium]
VANNAASHTLANVSQTTRVRVELRNGVCPSVSQAMDLVPQDLIAPTITCPANTTVNASPGQCGAVVSYPLPGVSDNCSASAAITIVCLDPAKASGSFFAVGTHTVVLRATDAAGNSSDCSFLITVANNLPATFSGCTDITVPIDAPLTCAVPVSYTAPTATDVCGQSVITSHTAGPTSGSLFPIGSTTVTYSATVGTNTHSCSFQVTVVDNAPPLIEAQALPILYTDPDCHVTVPDLTGHFPASSDCSGPLTVTQTPAANASVPAGTLVQLQATDPFANDTVVDIALLTVDTIAPVLTCPSSVSANIPNGACAVQVYFASPTISDNCSPAILTDSIGGGSGTWYGAGQHSVHYTAQDASGNAGHCTVAIEVLAPGAPVLAYGTATACATSGTLTPTVASPAGGTFSGTPGLIINGSGTVDPGASTPGDHQVRYTFPGTCAQTAVFDLHIDGPAVATTNVPASFCGSTGTLDASGNGPGVWSGPAAVTILNPSAPQTGVICSTPGSYTLTWTVTHGACTAVANATISFVADPSANAGNDMSLCADHAAMTLNGMPAGGTWSGTGLSGDLFTPSAAGVGVHQAVYAVTNAQGCIGTDTVTFTVQALPTVNAGSYASLCSNASSITLTGTPTGGAWSGIGVSGGAPYTFNPAVAGAGAHIITHTFTDANGCTGSGQTTITVHPTPTVTTGSYGPLCNNGAPIPLNGSPAGGTWSGTGVTGNSFNPSSGTQTLTYTVTNANGCSKSVTTTITVNNAPTVIPGNYGPLCSNGSAITLSGSPTGGTWSGTGVTGNSFNPSSGTQTLTYSFTNANGCTRSATTTIAVNNAPTVSTGSYGPLCSNAMSIPLSGSPSGGTWSGTGVTGNSFNPAAGTQTLTYSFTNANGCTRSATTTITVNNAPTVIPGSYGPLCTNGTAITLGGSPTGGTWSGTGVTGNSFSPSAGTQTLTYSFTNANGCTRSATTTITVNNAPSVATGTYGPLCSNGPAIPLSGSPSGGTWSGTGATGNSFTPSAGTQTLTYTYTNANGCTGTAQTNVTVHEPTVLQVTAPEPTCASSAPFPLIASPSGGTWIGTGIQGAQFSPPIAGAGDHILTYSFTNAFGCLSSASVNAEVHALPTVEAGTYAAICADASPLQLQGLPAGGTWSFSPTGGGSGEGLSGSIYDPAYGSQVLIYSYSDAQGCGASDQAFITVHALPVVDAGSDQVVCADAGLLTLAPTPTTGIWSGGTVNGQQYDVAQGPNNLTYTVTDANGCHAMDQVMITVHELPIVSAGADPTVCADADPIVLAPSPAGGTWSDPAVTANSYAPSSGSTTLTYTFTNVHGCTASDAVDITVHDLPTVEAGSDAVVCSDADALVFSPTPIGGSWNNPALTENSFDPAWGSALLLYSFTDANGCIGTDAFSITVHELPQVEAGTYAAICIDAPDVQLLGLPAGGVWTGNGVTGSNFDPDHGTQTLAYTFTDEHGCSGSDEAVITVSTLPSADAGTYGPYCSTHTAVPLNGSPANGTWSGPGVLGNTFSPSGLNGEQTLSYTVGSGACQAIATTTITVFAQPVVSAGPDAEACTDGHPLIGSTSAGSGIWSAPNGCTTTSIGTTEALAYMPQTGTYTFTWTVTNGLCSASDAITLTYHDPSDELWANAGPDQDFDIYLSTPLNGDATATADIQWSVLQGSGLFSDAHVPVTEVTDLAVGDNLLMLSASFGGCRTVSDTVRIHVNEVFIPQGYSPNGDGVNDLFEVTGAAVFPASDLRVFDRWGNPVFRSAPYRNEWDGRGQGGNALPDGTYYYTLQLAPERQYNGFVVIKR